MKKKVEILSNFVRCPFCNYLVETNNPITYCANCYVEYYRKYDEETDTDYLIFDSKLESEKYALAKALAKAGGVRFGGSLDEL